jgi:hypothetical protein
MGVTLAGPACKLDASLTVVVVAMEASGMRLARGDEVLRKSYVNAWIQVS